jgi:CheY-like chemotaxis protein
MGTPDIMPSLHGVRVLVVDDRTDDLEVMSLMLESLGAQVEGAGSAAAALEAIARSRPDVMVADIIMPGEDGLTLARKLRVDARGRLDLPSIAVSACEIGLLRTDALDAGYHDVAQKPLDLGGLARKIRRLVGNGGPASPAEN